MIRPYDSPFGGHHRLFPVELDASQTYDVGAAILIASGEAAVVADDTEVVAASFVGFAAQPSTGSTAASRAAAGLGRLQPAVEADIANQAGAVRTVYMAAADTLFQTDKFYSSSSSTTEADFNPNGTTGLWGECTVARPAGGEWGITAEAPSSGIDLIAQPVMLLDSAGQPVLAAAANVTAAVRAGSARNATVPYRIVFRIKNFAETLLGAGT